MKLANGDHSPNFFRQTSLLFHKWLAERFNLDDAWIVNVGYKNTSKYFQRNGCKYKYSTIKKKEAARIEYPAIRVTSFVSIVVDNETR
jgi:hypothetical protein